MIKFKNETKFVFGTLLCAVGVLIMFLAGTCSLWVLLSSAGGDLSIVLLVGGVPCAVGFGLFSAGKKLRKRYVSTNAIDS